LKLLLENWREYLEEDDSSPNWQAWTLAELDELISMARKEEGTQVQQWLSSTLGSEAVKALPYGGPVVTAIGVIVDLFKKINRQAGESDDDPKDYPILDILDIDPYLVRILDQDILNNIDEKYQKYIQELSPDTRLGDIKDINDFLRDDIAEMTFGHVVIRDES